METEFILGINLLVAVPTTLRSVKSASYPFSIVRHVVRGKQRKKAGGPIKIIHVMLLGTSFVVFVCLYCFVIVLFHRNPSLKKGYTCTQLSRGK